MILVGCVKRLWSLRMPILATLNTGGHLYFSTSSIRRPNGDDAGITETVIPVGMLPNSQAASHGIMRVMKKKLRSSRVEGNGASHPQPNSP